MTGRLGNVYRLLTVYFLGYDVGSSSVKACLLDGSTGRAVARGAWPEEEMAIASPRPGWAEQDPETWWDCVVAVTAGLLERSEVAPRDVKAIGISYQMHGLVTLDAGQDVVRPSIIWCDGRAVDIGERAFEALGRERCLERLLSSPGNFTASKLAWMREREPERFARIDRFCLPGDYIAARMTGRVATTVSGLSEGMLWDFLASEPADFVLEHYGIPRDLLPELVPTFGLQGSLTAPAAARLGLAPGTAVTFRAGDQPANALALNVLLPGDVAANAGTSGVVYGVTDVVRADPGSRVNSFAHVNHDPGAERPRLGVLLCVNGTGSAYRWLRHTLGAASYAALDAEAAASLARAGERRDALRFYPFGNGPERVLGNRGGGARLEGVQFNTHDRGSLARAVLDGVAFSLVYGLGVMGELGLDPGVMRAGGSNMMRSATFRQTLATLAGVPIELYDTDGAEGAARGAAFGAGHFRSLEEAFEGLARRAVIAPETDADAAPLAEAYTSWCDGLARLLEHD